MSNEQKLREALRETLLFCETFSNRWDGETGAHPFDMVERARQALATTEPEPTGMPEVKPLSDMDRAVLRMPMDMALGNDIGRLQYYQRVQGLLDRLDGIGLEVKT